jgi:hypothetical protein
VFRPGSKFEVQAVGPEGGFLELVWGNDEVTVYGWTGSMVSILAEGKEVLGSFGLPAPPLPGSSEAKVAAYMKLLKARGADDQ